MPVYELLFVLPGSLTEEELESKKTELKSVLETNGAADLAMENLGKHRLAYAIKHTKFGWYVNSQFELEEEKAKPIRPVLERFAGLLRYTFRVAPEKKRVYSFAQGALIAPRKARTQSRRKPMYTPKPVTTPAAKAEDAKPVDMKALDKKLDDLLEKDFIPENL